MRARDFAAKLSMRVLSRMWQMLLKGITEVQTATRPAAAAEMVLVRIAYVADLPTPDEAIRMLEQNGGAVAGGLAGGAAPRAHARRRLSSMSAALVRADAARPSAPRASAARPHADGQRLRPSRSPRRRCAFTAFRSWSRSPARSATC